MFNPLCKKTTIVLYSETRKYGLKFSTSIVFHPLDYYTLSDFTTTLYFFQKQTHSFDTNNKMDKRTIRNYKRKAAASSHRQNPVWLNDVKPSSIKSLVFYRELWLPAQRKSSHNLSGPARLS